MAEYLQMKVHLGDLLTDISECRCIQINVGKTLLDRSHQGIPSDIQINPAHRIQSFAEDQHLGECG